MVNQRTCPVCGCVLLVAGGGGGGVEACTNVECDYATRPAGMSQTRDYKDPWQHPKMTSPVRLLEQADELWRSLDDEGKVGEAAQMMRKLATVLNHVRLKESEVGVMALQGSALEHFGALPQYHGDHVVDMRDAVGQAQYVILCRAALRCHPEVFGDLDGVYEDFDTADADDSVDGEGPPLCAGCRGAWVEDEGDLCPQCSGDGDAAG